MGSHTTSAMAEACACTPELSACSRCSGASRLTSGMAAAEYNLTILHTNLAVYIGIVYAYVPFMVLPIYTALIRIDYSLVEAALDLGARPLKTFFTVIVPLTKGGIIAGSMLVFIPAVGEFVIPELLGGPDSIMIGRVLWQEFFNNRDWPVASAVAIIMLLLLIVPIMWFHKHQQKSVGEHG